MSLETINKKLIKMEKETPFNKLLLLSLIVAIGSTGIVFLNNPNYLSHYEQPLAKVMIISMLMMAFMTIPMVFLGGTLVCGIMLTWFLIKCRDRYYETNGKITGNSLATNVKFLYDLAQGLFPYLIGFIKSYNDPKFDEIEQRHQREKQELREEMQKTREEDMHIIGIQGKIIRSQYIKIAQLENRIDKLEKTNSETEQEISDKAHTNNNDKNTNLDTDEKFE